MRYDCDRLGAARCPSFSKSFFSWGVAATGVVAALLPKSKALPGVFGVLAAEPKEANAPDPKPNAVEPPVVGEATELAPTGVVLKGLLLLDDANLFCAV